MNREDIIISNLAGDRRTYLSPRTEVITMDAISPLAESFGIPRKDENTDEAYGKKWQGDDLDSWDEEAGNYKKEEWGSVW